MVQGPRSTVQGPASTNSPRLCGPGGAIVLRSCGGHSGGCCVGAFPENGWLGDDGMTDLAVGAAVFVTVVGFQLDQGLRSGGVLDGFAELCPGAGDGVVLGG